MGVTLLALIETLTPFVDLVDDALLGNPDRGGVGAIYVLGNESRDIGWRPLPYWR